MGQRDRYAAGQRDRYAAGQRDHYAARVSGTATRRVGGTATRQWPHRQLAATRQASDYVSGTQIRGKFCRTELVRKDARRDAV